MDIFEKSFIAIKESSNYSILLTSEFKESYNEFLQYLDLLSELKLKTEKELVSSIQDVQKLESIAGLNNMIDTNYDDSFDVSQMSHRILLSKIKLNVKSGINKKVSSFNSAQNVYQNAEALLNKELHFIASLSSNEIIEYINTKFNLSTISISLIPKMTLKEDETMLADKIINEYSTIISKYNVKEKIDFHSSNSNSELGGRVSRMLEIISKNFDVDIEEAKVIVQDKDSMLEKIKALPQMKQKIVVEALLKYNKN